MSNNNNNSEKDQYIYTDDDDFVLYKKGDKIMSGGFSIDSILLSRGMSPISTINMFRTGGSTGEENMNNNVSDIFKNLAVPSGLFYMQDKKIGLQGGKKYDDIDEKYNETIHDDIYEKLIGLSSVEFKNKKNNKTKKFMKKLDTKKQKKTHRLK
jgi:hypothetical protein